MAVSRIARYLCGTYSWASCLRTTTLYIVSMIPITRAPLPPIDTIWAMMIVWRTRGDYRTARAVLEAIIAFSALHTYYEQILQVKQICLCLTGFTSLCLDAYVFLCSCISLHACCIIVTRWGGPGGNESWSDDWPSSFIALTLLVGSHDL